MGGIPDTVHALRLPAAPPASCHMSAEPIHEASCAHLLMPCCLHHLTCGIQLVPILLSPPRRLQDSFEARLRKLREAEACQVRRASRIRAFNLALYTSISSIIAFVTFSVHRCALGVYTRIPLMGPFGYAACLCRR